MAVELRITTEVEQDLQDAFDWYEARRDGLGEEFLRSVDATIQEICKLPLAHRKVHAEYRRALVRRFPFTVFYDYLSETVTVYCVFHTSRSPQKWRQRLG